MFYNQNKGVDIFMKKTRNLTGTIAVLVILALCVGFIFACGEKEDGVLV